MLIWFIIGCEVGFWVLLALGLFSRYVLKLNTLSKYLLLSVPLLDLALLIATTVDLNRGSHAEFAHGLAVVYLGFTVVYGRSIIEWADSYIQYRFYSGKDPKNTDSGWAYARYEWVQWLKAVQACLIAAALLSIAIIYIDDPERTQALFEWYFSLFGILAVWLLGWPLWYTIFPKKKESSRSGQPNG